MFRVTLRLPSSLRGLGLAKRRREMAEAVVRQSQDRIRDGGDDEIRFAPLDMPRADGSRDRPLLGKGGLFGSIKPFVEGRSMGAETNHPGALVQLLGTTGKGGTLPPIKPKRAKALAFAAGGVMQFFRKVEIHPRKFFRFSRANVRELVVILFGKKSR